MNGNLHPFRPGVLILLLFAVAVVSSCASLHAPDHWLPIKEGAGATPNGGYISVKLMDRSQPRIEGELLATTNDTLYLVTLPPENAFHAIARDAVRSARVEYYDLDGAVGTQAVFSVVGSVASISTGLFLVFLVPLHIISGISTTSEISYYSSTDYVNGDGREIFHNLGFYARFPDGLPSAFNPRFARTKPMVRVR